MDLSTARGKSPAAEVDVDRRERAVYFWIMQFLATGPCTGAFSKLWKELLHHKLLPIRAGRSTEAQPRGHENVDVDLEKVYSLIMHFLAIGPCTGTFRELRSEVLRHKLLQLRNLAGHSTEGERRHHDNDDGLSFSLSYSEGANRNPHISDIDPGINLVHLLQQLLPLNDSRTAALSNLFSKVVTAADVSTLLGSGIFSLPDGESGKGSGGPSRWNQHLQWPNGQANQVHRLTLRELGGGVARYRRPPAVSGIAKPAIVFERIHTIKKLKGHRTAVYCTIFDRNAQLVITGSDDGLVKIWSTRTGFCLRSCIGHGGPISELAVSSDNKFVASASNDGCIRVWRLPDGFPVSVLGLHGGAVTAIAFSPRHGYEHHLLSSSDDGTCRIWDARDSAVQPHVYMPAPKDIRPVTTKRPRKASVQAPSSPPAIRILCCAFNADGTLFVAGSSDNLARVWSATNCNFTGAITQRPTYELDTLQGHKKHVHFVQFSGCGASARPFSSNSPKEGYLTGFKNTSSAHDTIVTFSRDTSAIIWIPPHGQQKSEVGRWEKAFHLRAMPHPIPSGSPRSGGRKQRSLLRKLRGVNIIVWSLDSRFLLGAIRDCKICVWNALDGSLVHSLTGHDKQTYVLDVHPFDPRIAMSAGYDGRVIIWDIWHGHPIRTYETGTYDLIDGNFSSDGSSLVVSDNVGQIYLFVTGDGSSQRNAKADQFFQGDYVALPEDNTGTVGDVGSAIYQRNIQDALCDERLFPYDLEYQSFYQQERLEAMGIERKPSLIAHERRISDPRDDGRLGPPGPSQPRLVPSPSSRDDGRLGPPGPSQPRVVPFPDIEDGDSSSGYTSDSDSDSEYRPSESGVEDDEDQTKTILDSGVRSTLEEEEAYDEDSGHTAYLRRSSRNKRKAEAQAVTSSSSRTSKRSRRMVASSPRQANLHHAKPSTRRERPAKRQAAIIADHRLSNIFYEEGRGAREERDDTLADGSRNESWHGVYITRRPRTKRKIRMLARLN